MPRIKIELLTPLKQYAGNQKTIEAEGDTIGAALSSLSERFPKLKEQLYDSTDHTRDFINIFLNGEDIRNHANLLTKLKDEDKIVIMAAIAGG